MHLPFLRACCCSSSISSGGPGRGTDRSFTELFRRNFSSKNEEKEGEPESSEQRKHLEPAWFTQGTCSLQQSISLFHRFIPQHQGLTFLPAASEQIQQLKGSSWLSVAVIQAGVGTSLSPQAHSPRIHSLLSQSFSVSLTDPIQQQLTWGNIYLKQKPPFGGVFKQKTKQQNIITVSALLKRHLRGNPETSLQYFCFQEVVMEDRKPHDHHYAPGFINSECSHAGRGAPSSTSSPDLSSAGHYSPATCGSQRGLPAFHQLQLSLPTPRL